MSVADDFIRITAKSAGNRHKQQCLVLQATVQASSTAPPEAPPVRVSDKADGSFELQCSLTRAGPFTLRVALKGASSEGLLFQGVCLPGEC